MSAFSVLLGAACGGDSAPSEPGYGYVSVSVLTTGGDIPVNAYTVVMDAVVTRTLQGGTQRAEDSFFVSAGTHSVRLGNVASNCAVDGENPRTVTTAFPSVAAVVFQVVCAATGLAITIRTTGSDIPVSYGFVLDDQPPQVISANGSQTIGGMAPGSHTLTLSPPARCTVAGGNQTTLAVNAKNVTAVSFDVTCTPAVRLETIAYAADTTIGTSTVRWLEMVNVDGTSSATLEAGAGDGPSWSPGRTQFAFFSTYCDYYDYYYGTCGGLRVFDPELGITTSINPVGYHLSWARTGDAIAFEVDGSSTGLLRLAILRFPERSVTTLDIAGPRSLERPSWSPDGTRIAFVCKWATTTDLCIVNANGTGLVRLTTDAEIDDHPAWSPDGMTIAFTRYPLDHTDDASADVVLLNLATSGITTLTKGTDPAWSPDGSKLVFAGANGLFVIGVDGANLRRLTTGPHHAPAWRP